MPLVLPLIWENIFLLLFCFKKSVRNERQGRWLPEGRGASQRKKKNMKTKGLHRTRGTVPDVGEGRNGWVEDLLSQMLKMSCS